MTYPVDNLKIMEKDWDNLIILDACRYDYFERIYKDYFRGTLKKAISPGSETVEWCEKVFKKYYKNTVYVSANPYVNSKGIGKIDARKNFYKIIDVWDWGWDAEKGVATPENVNHAALKARMDFSDKRLIIHYMQPHAPYLSLKDVDGNRMDPPASHGKISLLTRIRAFTDMKLEGWLGRKRVGKIRELLGLPPVRTEEAVLRKVGKERLRRAYEENLKIVFKNVSKLVKKLPGKTVITADHGELLFEGGEYGHIYGKHVPALIEVPYLEIERGSRKKKVSASGAEKQKIKNIIKGLKQTGNLWKKP